MGPMSYLVNKILTKLEVYKEEKEQSAQPRRSYNPFPLRSWSPEPRRESRKRTKFYNERYRNHTDWQPGQVKFNPAGYDFQAKKVNKRDSSGHGRNSRSECNLAGTRESRDFIISPGYRGRGRDASPRKSDSNLSRFGSRSHGESSQAKANSKKLSRSGSNKRHRPPNNRIEEVIPPVQPLPAQWTHEARNKTPLALRADNRPGQQLGVAHVPARNLQAEKYQRVQREAMEKKIQKHAVDWEILKRGKNEQCRLDAEKVEQEIVGNESAHRRESKKTESKKRESEEKAAARRRELEETEKKQREAIEKEAACQRELEKRQKRKKPEEVEKRMNADSLLILEMDRVEAAKRVNEERRLAVFGSIGNSNSSKTNLASPRQRGNAQRRETEQQRRPPAWIIGGPPAQTRGSGPQERPLERRDTHPAPSTPVPGMNGQQNSGQQQSNLSRRSSDPIAVQQVPNRAPRPKPKPPMVSPLTKENLRAQRGNFVEQAFVSELNRGLGDMTRTFIEGFYVPTELQSDVEDEDDD